jgi:hypothetical protein
MDYVEGSSRYILIVSWSRSAGSENQTFFVEAIRRPL